MLNGIVALHGTGVPPVTNSYESIATVTVGSGGSSSISFSSIPSTFKHLQIRLTAQSNRGTYGIDEINAVINSDISSSNYSSHVLFGNGASATAASYTGVGYAQIGSGFIGTTTGSSWGSMVVDVLDYSSTSKAKTLRTLGGTDLNGTVGGLGGRVGLTSAAWYNSSTAINSIVLTPTNSSTFSQHSVFALYGIKG